MIGKTIAWIKYLYYGWVLGGEKFELERKQRKVDRYLEKRAEYLRKEEKLEDKDRESRSWNPWKIMKRSSIKQNASRADGLVQDKIESYERRKQKCEELQEIRNYYADKIGKEKKEEDFSLEIEEKKKEEVMP